MKKLLGIVVLGLMMSVKAFADKHHHYFICEAINIDSLWPIINLEIDFKKNKVFRDGFVYEIGETDDLLVYAKKRHNDQIIETLNINRYTQRLNVWVRDKGTFQFNCDKIQKKF